MSSRFLSPDQTTALLRQLRITDQIGTGSYATVYQVVQNAHVAQTTRKPGQSDYSVRYAIKHQMVNSRFSNDAGVQHTSLIEINTLRLFHHHDHIVDLHGIFFQPGSINLILELATQSLYSYILMTPPYQRIIHARSLLMSLTKAVTTMDRLDYHHFDIKPQNVLVKLFSGPSMSNEPIFKLADFGLAFSNSAHLNHPGEVYTIWYRPPELHAAVDYYTNHPREIEAGDIWSIGATVLEMVTGRSLIQIKSSSEFFEVIPSKIKKVYLFNVLLEPHQKQMLDWAAALQGGLLTGQINVDRVLQDRLSLEDYLRVDPNVIMFLKEMLEISPFKRISGIDILERSGDSPSMDRSDIDQSDLRESSDTKESNNPQESIGRMIDSSNLNRLVQIGLHLGCSDKTLVYGCDFLMRYEYQLSQGLIQPVHLEPLLDFHDDIGLSVALTVMARRNGSPPLNLSDNSSSEDSLDLPDITGSSDNNSPLPPPPPPPTPPSSPDGGTLPYPPTPSTTPPQPLDRSTSLPGTLPNPPTEAHLADSLSAHLAANSWSSESDDSAEITRLTKPIQADPDLTISIECSRGPVQMMDILACLKIAFDLNELDLLITDDLLDLFIWNRPLEECRSDFIISQQQILTALNFELSTSFSQRLTKWLQNQPHDWFDLSEYAWLECFFED